MRKSRFTEEQKIAVVPHAAAGGKISELCRKRGITETTFYRWRAKYDGLQVSDAKRFRALEDENGRLKKLVADLALDNAMLKDVVGRKR
jgi:putative transposase